MHNLIVESKMKNIASNNIQQKNSRQIIFQSYKQKNYRQINFQSYIDTVKEDKISWNFFISLMRDLSHTNIDRLKTLNEILLNELKISIHEKRYKNPQEKIKFPSPQVDLSSVFSRDCNDDDYKDWSPKAPGITILYAQEFLSIFI